MKQKILKYGLKYGFAFILAAYSLVIAYFIIFQRDLLYYPERVIYSPEYYNLSGVHDDFIETVDGCKLQIWYRKSDTASRNIIFFPGRAGNKALSAGDFENFISRDWNFVALSWRGFGKSNCSPTMEGLYNDARTTIEWARDEQGFNLDDTIVVAYSLGTGIATYLSREYNFEGIMMKGPYTDVANRGQQKYPYVPVRLLLHDNYSNIKYAPEVSTPVLIVHGTDDSVVPVEESEELMKYFKPGIAKRIVYEGVGHFNLNVDKIYDEMDAFFIKDK